MKGIVSFFLQLIPMPISPFLLMAVHIIVHTSAVPLKLLMMYSNCVTMLTEITSLCALPPLVPLPLMQMRLPMTRAVMVTLLLPPSRWLVSELPDEHVPRHWRSVLFLTFPLKPTSILMMMLPMLVTVVAFFISPSIEPMLMLQVAVITLVMFLIASLIKQVLTLLVTAIALIMSLIVPSIKRRLTEPVILVALVMFLVVPTIKRALAMLVTVAALDIFLTVSPLRWSLMMQVMVIVISLIMTSPP